MPIIRFVTNPLATAEAAASKQHSEWATRQGRIGLFGRTAH